MALKRLLAILLFIPSLAMAQAEECPRLDFEANKAKEADCKANGGLWARHGVRDHLCGVYSCAVRTRDAGQRCTSRSECQYLCITKKRFPLGAPVIGECAEFITEFGCINYVEGGKMTGRVCVD